MKMFQKYLDSLYPESHIRDVTFVVVWNVLTADENKSVNRPSMNWTSTSLLMCLFVHGTIYMDHEISSKVHAEWFFYPSNCQSHILDRTSWLDRTTPYLGIPIT